MAKNYDHLFKLLIIGDSGVGKSCILQRFAGDEFPTSYVSTIGVDFKIQALQVDGETVKLQVWDTAGQERFRTITSTYYRGTHGVIIVFDLTSAESFLNIKRWLYEIDQNCDSVSKIIVGNKMDCADDRLISTNEIKSLADPLNIPFFEASAKQNINIQETFMFLTRMVLRTKKEQQARITLQTAESFKLTTKSPKSRKKKQKKC